MERKKLGWDGGRAELVIIFFIILNFNLVNFYNNVKICHLLKIYLFEKGFIKINYNKIHD